MWELHKRKAERGYQQLREDTAFSQGNPVVDVITFDLQQSFPIPVPINIVFYKRQPPVPINIVFYKRQPPVPINIVFYKRQPWVYNLGIHRCASEKGYMYMWDESVASRGSQEVGSCIITYLKEHPT